MGAKAKLKSRILIRPSGWVFLVIYALVQVAAFNSGENLLYLVAGATMAFLFVSVFMTWLTTRKLVISREAPEAVHRDETFWELLRIENRKRVLPAASLKIHSASGVRGSSTYVELIAPRRAAAMRLLECMPKRGVQPLPPLRLNCAFPFGLFGRELRIIDRSEIVVYPKVTPIKRAVLEQLDGMGMTPRINRGEGDEFFSLRDYVPGDDPRRIAWKVSARRRQLVVRELEPNNSRSIMIVLDTRFPGFPDSEFEDGVDLAASLAVSFLNYQYNVGLATPEDNVPMGIGNTHRSRILDALARVTAAAPDAYPDTWYGRERFVYGAANLYLSADPAQWGRTIAYPQTRVLNPREIVYAEST